MLRHLWTAWKALRDDQRGNVIILFAASAIPLLLVMGGAVDVSRFARHKAVLSNVIDAAGLALARVGQQYTDEQATTFVENYVSSFPIENDKFDVKEFHVTRTDNGYAVAADAAMDTMFLPLGFLTETHHGLMKMGMNIASQVVFSSNRVELALVFDNTGSMGESAGSNACGGAHDRMTGLKCAATTLVGDLMDQMNDGDGEDQLKVALVPFEGAVNVGVDTSNPPWWIEWSDEATTADLAQPYYTGINFDQKDFGSGGSHDYRNIGPKWLFDKLGVPWAGCVEARAEPYDLEDTPPDASNPDTLFVPMFWPDEPDYYSIAWNNYLHDGVSGGWTSIQRSLTKYDKSSPSGVSWQYHGKDTTYPYDFGPEPRLSAADYASDLGRGDHRFRHRGHAGAGRYRHFHPGGSRLGLARAVTGGAVYRRYRARRRIL